MLLSEGTHPTAVHYRILVLTWAGWLFDFYDLILYTFLLAPIAADLGLGREAHALVMGVSLGATAAGGALFGALADAMDGRRCSSGRFSPTAWVPCSADSRPASGRSPQHAS